MSADPLLHAPVPRRTGTQTTPGAHFARFGVVSLALLASVGSVCAQSPRTPEAEFAQARIDTRSDARSLIVATHPDDPYRALALWLRREHGHRVRVLVVTRGAGGQNAVGPELGEELARLRTEESRAAARRLDVELQFLGLRDFGYCREAAEALDRWRADEAGEKLRRELVRFRPDFVWTPHGPEETHGQKAAVFTLLKQALRQLPRPVREDPPAFFHLPPAESTPLLRIDLQTLDPLQSRSYRELAHEALLEHRTQGPHGDVLSEIPDALAFSGDGPLPSAWQSPLEAEAARAATGISFGEEWRAWLQTPRRRESWPTELARHLAAWRAARAKLEEKPELDRRLQLRCAALAEALQLGSRVRLPRSVQVPFESGQRSVSVPVRLHNGGWSAISVPSQAKAELGAELRGAWKHSAFELRPGEAKTLELELNADASSVLPPRVAAELVVRVLGQELHLPFEVVLQRRRPLTLEARPKRRFLVPANGALVRLSLAIRKSDAAAWRGELGMLAPSDVAFLPESNAESLPIRVDLPARALERWIALRVRLPDWGRRAGEGRLPWISARFGLQPQPGADFDASCELAFRPVRVSVPTGIRIGIVRGPDDTIEEALRSFGLDVVVLDERTLARVDLAKYQTVLVDSRALHRRFDAVAWIPRFCSYAERGGHLVVLYHKDSEFNESDVGARLAPFPLQLGKERITREDAPVRVLQPEHRMLNVPNRILPGDWDGWVQERGLYLPEMGAYDPRFDEILEIQEVPFSSSSGLAFEAQRGALLFARTGSGSYLYCALVLHRQLRAYHAGAARLLLNLVTPASWR